MNNELLLLSGSDIPFPEAKITIHQPTLKEIGYIGEDVFFIGCGFLDFSKELLADKDKIRLSNYNDFDILMTIMGNTDKTVKHTVNCAKLVLSLLFPHYTISVRPEIGIIIARDEEICVINRENYSIFKDILTKMFNLDLNKKNVDKYNPAGSMSERIAQKFKKRQEQLAKLAKEEIGDGKRIAILSRYTSILAVGLQKNLNDLAQYTVYQLYDEFQRFQLKLQWDAYVQAKMAGAKDIEEVDNWMIDLQNQGQNKNKKNKTKK